MFLRSPLIATQINELCQTNWSTPDNMNVQKPQLIHSLQKQLQDFHLQTQQEISRLQLQIKN